jgi:polyphosphate kinase
MTTGALIFARNNEHTDYVAMAQWSARNIERHLGIETHIVTDDSRQIQAQDILQDVGTVTWHNTNRMDAYKTHTMG